MLNYTDIHEGGPDQGLSVFVRRDGKSRKSRKPENPRKVQDKEWEHHYKEVTRNVPTCYRPNKDGIGAPVHREYWIKSRKDVDHSSDRSMRQFMKKNTMMHMTCICRFCHMDNNHYKTCCRKMARSKVERLRRQAKAVTTDMLDF